MNNNYRLTTEQFEAIQNQIQPKIEDGVIQSIDARRLHQWLGIGKDFSTWIKDQIARAGLVEHEDYEVFTRIGENPFGGRPTKEYALSPDAAKEIAMMCSSEKGKLMRSYFIDCEKRLRGIPHDYETALEHLLLSVKEQNRLKLENQRQQMIIEEKTEDVIFLKGNLANREYEKLLTATELSRQLSANIEWSTIEGNRRFNWNPSSHDIMDYLRDRQFIFKNGRQVQQKCIDKYGDVLIAEQGDWTTTFKFNINSEGFVSFVKDMKKYMLENKIGLKKSGYLPGLEF